MIPTFISGCVLWLDASQVTGISNGQTISQWNDLSGNGNHATQSVPSRQPIYSTNKINNKPSITFSGSQLLQLSSNILYNTLNTKNNCSIFIITKRITANSNELIFGGVNAQGYGVGAYGYGLRYESTSNLSLQCIASSTGTHISVNETLSSYTILSNIISSNSTMYKNGVALGTNNSMPNTSGNGYGDSIGGANNNSTYGCFYNGEISEIILYNKNLSDNERIYVETYLSDKYALSVNQKKYPEYYLIKQGTQYYSIKPEFYDNITNNNYIPLTLAGSAPTDNEYVTYGFDDPNTIMNTNTSGAITGVDKGNLTTGKYFECSLTTDFIKVINNPNLTGLKALIEDNTGALYTYNGTSIASISKNISAISNTDFTGSNGISDLTAIANSVWTTKFPTITNGKILIYTSDQTVTSAKLVYTSSTINFVPYTKLGSSFDVKLWKSN